MYSIKIAHRADKFSTDALGKLLLIICKCRSSKKMTSEVSRSGNIHSDQDQFVLKHVSVHFQRVKITVTF